MPYLKIWIHLVWSTKHRTPWLTSEIRSKLFSHMKSNAYSKDIRIVCINGYVDHVHVLVSLQADQAIAKVAQLLKGESSYWINKNNLINAFEWQHEYFASSVSESALKAVTRYIENQELHHEKGSVKNEYEAAVESWQ